MSDQVEEKANTIAVDYAELQFGEKVYHVPAAGLTRSEAWRGRLQVEINAALALLREQGGVFEKIDLNNLKKISNLGLMELIPLISSAFAQLNVSMSALSELICLYSAELERDREYILEHATTRQAIAAVVEMVRLEFPFGLVLGQNGKPGVAGQVVTMMSPSLPSRPGKSNRRH